MFIVRRDQYNGRENLPTNSFRLTDLTTSWRLLLARGLETTGGEIPAGVDQSYFYGKIVPCNIQFIL
jgi:hypothetical protein